MFEKFEKIVEIFNDLEKQLIDPNISRDRNNFEKIAREHKELSVIVRTFHDWEKLKDKKEETEVLLNESDSEIHDWHSHGMCKQCTKNMLLEENKDLKWLN